MSASAHQICDLGCARILDHTAIQTTSMGTFAWMAPEVGHNVIITARMHGSEQDFL